MTPAADVGLLAPVPEIHLMSALEKCAEEGKVGFGSRAFSVFRELDALRRGKLSEVYIYASAGSKYGMPKVRWRALYIGHVASIGGSHPQGMKYRPATTLQYQADNRGHWAVFWEIAELRTLKNEDAFLMSKFRGWQTNKRYVSTFIPEGPLLVEIG